MSVRILANIELFNDMLNMAPSGLTYTSTFCLTILLWLRWQIYLSSAYSEYGTAGHSHEAQTHAVSPQSSSVSWAQILSPLYRWGSPGSERLTDSPQGHTAKKDLNPDWSDTGAHIIQHCLPSPLLPPGWEQTPGPSPFSRPSPG